MIKINLVPQEVLDKELQKQRALQVGVVAGLLALGFVGVSYGHHRKKVKLERQLTQLEATLKTLEKEMRLVQALENQAKGLRARLGVVNNLLKSRELYPRFMTELLKTLPSGVWLLTLDTRGSDALSLDISAAASSSEAIADWLRTLEETKQFSGSALGPITITGRTHRFNVSVKYTPPKEGA